MKGIRYRGKEDPIYLDFPPSELPNAVESLKKLLPFLTRDLCRGCNDLIADRVLSLDKELSKPSQPEESFADSRQTHQYESDHSNDNCDTHSLGNSRQTHQYESDHSNDNCDTHSLGSWKDGANGWSEHVVDASTSEVVTVDPPNARLSWADMADELEERGGEEEEEDEQHLEGDYAHAEVEVELKVQKKPELPREQREYIRFMNVQRKKDFICLERINGKIVNIVDGLELHTCVFSAAEQKRIVDFVFELREKGRKRELRERTFSAPQKWMRGKGRVTIQFGCCYNYATDRNGNPPGILRSELVDPLPNLFKVIIRRLVQWHVLPPSCVPDSCIVNIYEEGDCIPPHIDNHDFVRPFCTVSFLSECNILFGSNLKIVGPGEFAGSIAIPLPVGSVLVLNGNGADVAKHCVPAVPTRRISITFRKMDEAKRPLGFTPEPDLQDIQPLSYDSDESESLTPLKSPRSAKWQPAMRNGSSEKGRGFLGRGNSYSEPRQPVMRNGGSEKGKGIFGRGSGHSEPRQPVTREGSSEKGRGILGRGSSHSEPRQLVTREESSEKGRGFLGRDGNHSDPRHTAPTLPQHMNRPRTRLSLGKSW